MKRLVALAALLTAALAVSPAAAATRTASARGSIVSLDDRSITILSGAKTISTRAALARSADAVDGADYPYVWGGGHGSAGSGSTGSRGPGHNGRRVGFDCSGSVAAVLAGAGVWTWGASVPGDADVVSQLLRAHLIARGPGEVTLFDKPGSHIFMRIGGRYFGTSDGGKGNQSQRHGGAGWLYDGAPDANRPSYRQYHLLASVLRARTLYGARLTFTTPSWSTVSGFEVGDSVRISYTSTGPMRTARAITYTNAKSADGTVIAVAQDGSTLTIQTSAHKRITFEPGENLTVDASALGDRISVLYTIRAGTRAAHSLTVLSAASLITVSGTVTAVAQDGSSFTIQSADGGTLTFSTGDDPELIGDYSVGDNVQISYVQVLSTKVARNVEDAPAPETNAVGGTITTIAADGSSFAIQTDDGRQMTFLAHGDIGIETYSAGDSVEVSYIPNINGTLVAQRIAGAGMH